MNTPNPDQNPPNPFLSDHSSDPLNPPIGGNGGTPPTAYPDWREQRREERRTRHEARLQRHAGGYYTWIGGAFLVLLGILFMLQNLGFFIQANWWGLFFFLPAIGAFATAWMLYRKDGLLTRGVISSIAGGILSACFGLAILLNIDISLFWPIFLVVGGLVLLATAVFPTNPNPENH